MAGRSQRKTTVPQDAAGRSKRILVFKTISFLIPFVLLLLLEVILRAVGYGYDPALFEEYAGDKNFLVMSPDASRRYFVNQKNATTGNRELFRKKKEANTFRVFILGESTTIGYPYFHNGSFHRWLQYRLTHTFPERNFEIINISLTAVNSYTVLGFAKEVVNYEPDAVLIYAGHNEYYGALGVGSTENLGGSPYLVNLIIYLRQFRIVQLMTNVYEKTAGFLQKAQPVPEGTRMQQMVADQKIPYQSSLYKSGVEQFRSNMDETLNLFKKNHIPVFISNLVSNEKDLKPFVSFPVDSLKFPGFSQNYNLGIKAFNNNNKQAAYNYLKAANQIYNVNASCNYYLGKLAYDNGNFGQAKEYFSKARDLDGLRFRAPEEFNTILTRLCAKYPNTRLVDTKAAFEAVSPNGIIGENLILEHVHPDLKGYALMSDAFYKTLKNAQLIDTKNRQEIAFEDLLRLMPITTADSLSGVYKIAKLKNSWPFTESMQAGTFTIGTFEEKLGYELANREIQWSDAMDGLYNHYSQNRDFKKALTVVETLILEYPSDPQLYLKSAMLCGELKDEKNALFYFQKAFSLAPSFDIARYLFVLHLKQDQPAKAIPYLDYAIANNTSGFNLKPVKDYAEKIIALQKTMSSDTSNVAVLNEIAQAYLKMDNQEGVSKYARKILAVDGGNKEAAALLLQLRAGHSG